MKKRQVIDHSRTRYGIAAAVGLAVVSATASAQGICAEWVRVPSPAPPDRSFFHGVHGLASNDVWAVGEVLEQDSGDIFSLAAHWDGSEWTPIPTPSPGVYENGGIDVSLYDVRATGPDEAWAVGTYWTRHPLDGYVGFQTIALHWNGDAWMQVETPITPVGGTGAWLLDIDDLGADQVWAVGDRVASDMPGSGMLRVALMLRWDGATWSELPAPPQPSIHAHTFRALEAFAPDDILAVGGHNGTNQGADLFHPWLVHWNGASWTELEFPQIAGRMYPQDMEGAAPNDIWIVGHYYDDDTLDITPLLMHFNGSEWTFHDPGLSDVRHASLNAVTVNSPTDVWAVGDYSISDDDPYNRPLLLHFDGQAWMKVDSASGGEPYGWLWDAFAVDGCDVWAVGESAGATETQRLFTEAGGYDLELSQTPLRRGAETTLTVTGAEPGERVYFLYSLGGTGAGPCPPQLGGLCLDLRNPITQMGSDLADQSGVAALTQIIPPGAPLGREVSTQAVARRGVGGADSVKSNPHTATIEP